MRGRALIYICIAGTVGAGRETPASGEHIVCVCVNVCVCQFHRHIFVCVRLHALEKFK